MRPTVNIVHCFHVLCRNSDSVMPHPQGLYPESHGVVDNRMHDPHIKKDFNLNDSASITNPKWWGGEPIWNTVMKEVLILLMYLSHANLLRK